ncbi:glycosyltransferase [Cohnella algarum]|uniref:glycosyltransferase n=1 Tax=Cohnella algarum TaxID=2044859 RepID=UPI00196726E3|nr:glycosyltransferase [Cohnella algarum]
MHTAKAAIITRTKDRPIMLKRAFKSVADQTFCDWVHVIVNDGGEQETVEKLVSELPSRIQKKVVIIHNEVSQGMEAASNIGIKAVDSSYILIHDDDDTLQPDFLEQTVSFLESAEGEDFGGVATKIIRVIEEIDGDEIRIHSKDLWKPNLQSISLAEMAIQNTIVPISIVYRRHVHHCVGYYNEKLPVLGDWDFYLRFLSEFNIHLINEALANYHHRISLKTGVYSNTIFGLTTKHNQVATQIRNDYLRKDLREGKMGIGHLINIAKINSSTDHLQTMYLIEHAKKSIFKQLKFNQVGTVILYGTGEFAKDLFQMLLQNDIDVKLFVDSKKETWGRTLFHVPIVSIEEAVKSEIDNFVVGSFNYAEEIAANINAEFKKANKQPRIFCH